MARFRINIFYVFSSICSLLLIGYIWLVFLPIFEHTAGYDFIRNIAFVLTALLSISAGIQLFLSIMKEKDSEEMKPIYTDR